MPDIGATLREARMRQRIDISDIEAQTKIRAKYLRALENEEWDLLPGPTFVKTFLRTYAEALGLDARMLLEEYKLRYERLADHEVLPIAPPSGRHVKRRGGPSVGRDVLVAGLVVALVAVLVILGNHSGGGDDKAANTVATTPTSTTAAPGDGHGRTHVGVAKQPRRATRVRLRLVPTAPVYVCLKAGSRVLLREATITAPTKTYRARSFRVLLGNGNLSMQIDGRRRAVPQVSKPIAYLVTPRGRRTVAADVTKICA